MRNAFVPSDLPCPHCGQLAMVFPLICKFQDVELMPLVCPHCISVSAVTERAIGVFRVSECNLSQQELLTDLMVREAQWEERAKAQLDAKKKARYN